jgi:hypothetical protein
MHLLVLLLSFSPDRPGFADSTETVSAGSVQMELGLRSSFEDDATSLALPSMLLRVGLLDWLEVRATAPDLQVDLLKDDGGTNTGAGDMSFGFKSAFAMGDLFSLSAVPFVTLPTGSRGYSSGAVDAGLGLNFQVAVSDFSVGWNAILVLTSVDEERVFDFGAGLSFGYQFVESFGAFVETYLVYLEGERVQPSVAGGLTYLVTPTFQIDVSGGAGVTRDAEGPYVLGGIAVLL